jgi:pyridoxal phosphate enzyme (YggS family)
MSETIQKEIAALRLSEVKKNIEKAAKKAGRDPKDITLLAVSKTFPAEDVESYIAAGQKDFGESYVQEAKDKIPTVQGEALWHFIGHLQTNKAKYAYKLFSVIHALDSLELANELHKRLSKENLKIEAYIQINVSKEASKSGLAPAELPPFLEGLRPFDSIIPIGLMTMPPYDIDPEAARPYFIKLRELRDKEAPHLKGLSMGMSGDYETAIEEGATIVRVGTALFGAR